MFRRCAAAVRGRGRGVGGVLGVTVAVAALVGEEEIEDRFHGRDAAADYDDEELGAGPGEEVVGLPFGDVSSAHGSRVWVER